MKNKIKTLSVDGEIVHLKKGFMGWNVIAPYKNEDGSINWFNILTGGSWKRLIIMIFIVLIILGVIYEYTTNMNILLSCFEDRFMLEECAKSFGTPSLVLVP